MICIYKYTNKINKKAYIGLTNDMDRRRREHRLVARKKKDNTYFHNALQKYGEDNFDFEILEVFKQEDRVLMGERESYWIQFYNTHKTGYNETTGGDISQGKSKLTKEDVIQIRLRYKNCERKMDVYQDYKHMIGHSGFHKVWGGASWKNIMPEIYTEERATYHATHTGMSGVKNGRALLDETDVFNIRTRYKNKEPLFQIYQDYKHTNIAYGSFANTARGDNWKHIKV